MEESADEAPGVEAAISPALVGGPPRTRARLEAAREEEEAEKAASATVVQTPPRCHRAVARRSCRGRRPAHAHAGGSGEVEDERGGRLEEDGEDYHVGFTYKRGKMDILTCC